MKRYLIEVKKALDWNAGYLAFNGKVVESIEEALEFESKEDAEIEAALFNIEYGRNGETLANPVGYGMD